MWFICSVCSVNKAQLMMTGRIIKLILNKVKMLRFILKMTLYAKE